MIFKRRRLQVIVGKADRRGKCKIISELDICLCAINTGTPLSVQVKNYF